MSRPDAHDDARYKGNGHLDDDQWPSSLQVVRDESPDPNKDHLNSTATNRDGVDLSCSPRSRAIGIFQALQEQSEEGISIIAYDGTDVEHSKEIGDPVGECTPTSG